MSCKQLENLDWKSSNLKFRTNFLIFVIIQRHISWNPRTLSAEIHEPTSCPHGECCTQLENFHWKSSANASASFKWKLVRVHVVVCTTICTLIYCRTIRTLSDFHIERSSVLQCVATHYNTLQHTATHYNTLQHTATHKDLHFHTTIHIERSSFPYSYMHSDWL